MNEIDPNHKYTAMDYLMKFNVVNNDLQVALNGRKAEINEQAKAKTQGKWEDLINEYDKKTKEGKWTRKDEGQQHVFSMMPEILSFLGAKGDVLKIYGSFFNHVLKHPGMDLEVLKQLPKAMEHPLMVFEGNLTKNDIKEGIVNNPLNGEHAKVVMLLDVVNSNGVNIVVPVEINKTVDGDFVSFAISAYAKEDKQNSSQLNVNWLEKNMEKHLIYIDKEKSSQWMGANRNQLPGDFPTRIAALDENSILTEKDFVKNIYEQAAYHGSGARFDRFDLGRAGEVNGTNHGWGLYFAKNKKSAEWYKELGKWNKDYEGSLYEVDVPDNDVLLDEQKTLDKQPAKVKKAIKKCLASLPAERLRTTGMGSTIADAMKNTNGATFYDVLSAITGSQRAASELLNKYGIKGITYDGQQDGRCYVVFDDKAVEIVDVYNQKNGATLQGQSAVLTNGERFVSLLKNADTTTFFHETGHIFYEDLKRMSEMFGAPEWVQRDYATLEGWLAWTPEQLKGYEGTSGYGQMAAIDKRIRELLKEGQGARIEGQGTRSEGQGELNALLERWKRERWARAVEEYVYKGNVPSEGLRKLLYDLKKWLVKVYRAFRGAGVPMSDEVRAVMDRMLVSQDVVDASVARRDMEKFKRAGGLDFAGESGREVWENLMQTAREEAEAKVRELALADLAEERQKEMEEQRKKEREAAKEMFAQRPHFVVKAFLDANPKADIDFLCNKAGITRQEYEENLKADGGSVDAAVEKFMRDTFEPMLQKEFYVSDEELRQRAEEALTESRYRAVLTAYESGILDKASRKYSRLYSKIMAEQAQRRKAQQDADRVLNRIEGQGTRYEGQGARYEGQGTGYEGQGVRFDVSDIKTERDKLKKLQPVEVEVGKVSDRDRSNGIGAAVKAFEEVYGENGVKEKTVLGEVLIDGDSIKSSLGHLRYAAKYDVVLSLPEGIKKAAYMGNIPNGENGLPNHYFVYKIQYGAENKYVLCRVKNTDKGLKLYVHDVFDDEFVDKTIKKANSLQTLAPRKGDVTQGRVNPYKQIIFNFFGNVNDNNKGQSLSDAKSIEYFGVSLPGHSRDTDGAEVSQGNAPLRSSANNNITYKGVAVKDMTDLEKRQYREQVQRETIKQLKQELHNQKSATRNAALDKKIRLQFTKNFLYDNILM